MKPIVLLDLNYTFVNNSRVSWPNFRKAPLIAIETYRDWLIPLMSDHHVILVTVRSDSLAEATLANIHRLTGWQPNEVYFKSPQQVYLKAPKFKEWALRTRIMPQHGKEPARYLALESNAETRAMYAQNNIWAVKVPDASWSELPTKTAMPPISQGVML